MRVIVIALFLLVGLPEIASPENELPDSLRVMLAKYMRFTKRDLSAVKSGKVVQKALESNAKSELVFFGIIYVNAPPALLVQRFQDIETFKQGEAVSKVKKISSPPSLADFKELTLEKDEIKELKKCKPAKCSMKLSTEMIDRLHKEANWSAQDHSGKINELYRNMLFEYVQSYLAEGNARLIEYQDQKKPLSLRDEFTAIVKRSQYLQEKMPEFCEYLTDYPDKPLEDVDNFLYWSKETLKFRPVVTITHVSIYRHTKFETFIASKQIYANHYLTGSLGITGLLSENEDPDQPGFYLLYLNRSRTDMLGGLLSGLKRSLARSRSTAALEENLTLIKNRLEKEFAGD